MAVLYYRDPTLNEWIPVQGSSKSKAIGSATLVAHTPLDVAHNLGDTGVSATFYEGNEMVMLDVAVKDANTLTLRATRDISVNWVVFK
jgi:hypothetical protein